MTTISSNAIADQALWAAKQATRQQGQASAPTLNATGSGRSASAPESKGKVAGQQFEAMFLRQMLDEWMPKDSKALFGEGTAGNVWRSMLADHTATEISKAGSIGIAQMIMKAESNGSKGK